MNEMERVNNEGELVDASELTLNEKQFLEQLYSGAGLEPVVEAGIRDYDERLQKENKLLNKVLGTRGDDIKGYGQAVARRVAFAVYQMLNREYGGKVGDLRAHINELQEERDRAKEKYDELMGRVVGILGEEYKELRADSKMFMEKLTHTLGEDLKESKIDHKALAERLADIDGLRDTIKNLENEKEEIIRKYDARIEELQSQHKSEIDKLNDKISGLQDQIKGLQKENAKLNSSLEKKQAEYERLKASAVSVRQSVPYQEISDNLAEEMHAFLLEDSKVPHLVLDGVGKFLDMKKYLKMAAEKGAEEAASKAEASLGEAIGDKNQEGEKKDPAS